jgi:hypothetical protein
MGLTQMAKDREMRLSTVKIESTTLRKAKMVADRLGEPVSTYLSRVLLVTVERDLDKIYKRLLKEQGDEERRSSHD